MDARTVAQPAGAYNSIMVVKGEVERPSRRPYHVHEGPEMHDSTLDHRSTPLKLKLQGSLENLRKTFFFYYLNQYFLSTTSRSLSTLLTAVIQIHFGIY